MQSMVEMAAMRVAAAYGSFVTYQALLTLIRTVLTVGEQVLAAQVCRSFEVLHKGGATSTDIVTGSDLFSENALIQSIRGRFPGHEIVAEESAASAGGRSLVPVWYIDPLDGTKIYTTGLRHWGMSVGLAVEDEPVIGILHFPGLGKTVIGAVGVGAWSEERQLPRASDELPPLQQLRVGVEWTSRTKDRRSLEPVIHGLIEIQDVLKTGSTVYDQAAIVESGMHGLVIPSTNTWDVCAGVAILVACGFEVKTMKGNDFTLSASASEGIVAGIPGIWECLQRLGCFEKM